MDHRNPLQRLIESALAEDIGEGDHSALCCIDPEARGRAVLHIKQAGVLAGLEVARYMFETSGESVEFKAHFSDGDLVSPGQTAFDVVAPVQLILRYERVLLNIMQRMSGIASLTRKYVDRLQGYSTRLLDTRKTTPNFRLLEKMAVRIGGGENHRFGLYDMIMLKDNHIDYCGSLEQALQKAHAYVRSRPVPLKIEIETRNTDEVLRVVRTGLADRIMFDNFSVSQVEEALRHVDGRCETEASGGIHLENIQNYAATGVDFVSSGALIHQATSIDLSLKATPV